jgi:hypothetical protein
MTRIIRVRPRDTDETNEVCNWIFLGMLIQELAYLGPVGWSIQSQHAETKLGNVPGDEVNKHVIW